MHARTCMCARGGLHAQPCSCVSSSAWSPKCYRRQTARSAGRGLERASWASWALLRGLHSLVCERWSRGRERKGRLGRRRDVSASADENVRPNWLQVLKLACIFLAEMTREKNVDHSKENNVAD